MLLVKSSLQRHHNEIDGEMKTCASGQVPHSMQGTQSRKPLGVLQAHNRNMYFHEQSSKHELLFSPVDAAQATLPWH